MRILTLVDIVGQNDEVVGFRSSTCWRSLMSLIRVRADVYRWLECSLIELCS